MDKITGQGCPSNQLPGAVGQFYEDTNNGDIYECQSIMKDGDEVLSYVWVLRASGEHVDRHAQIFGGGGSSNSGVVTAIIKQDGFENWQNGGASDPATYTCTNMTFEQAVQVIQSGTPFDARMMVIYYGHPSHLYANAGFYDDGSIYYAVPNICFNTNTDSYYWTADGISTEEPPAREEFSM